jgi:hypothetical protein
MMHTRPLVVVPPSRQVSEMIEVARLAIEPRAQRIGILLVAPRTMRPAGLMAASCVWPAALARAGVTRVAVVLPVEAFVVARPVLRGCVWRMKEQGVEVAYFHEGQLGGDDVHAWFARRATRRRVSTDSLMQLRGRYLERDDARSAHFVLELAEAGVAREPGWGYEDTLPPASCVSETVVGCGRARRAVA